MTFELKTSRTMAATTLAAFCRHNSSVVLKHDGARANVIYLYVSANLVANSNARYARIVRDAQRYRLARAHARAERDAMDSRLIL